VKPGQGQSQFVNPLRVQIGNVLGVGYTYVGDALNGRLALQIMALLVILKVVATTSSYASGNAGGIFGPSLFIGAMAGGTVGSLAHAALPQYTAQSRRICVGWDGHCLCWNCSGAVDVGHHDFRDDARLQHYRPADDFQPCQLLHIVSLPEAANLRSTCASGRNSLAEPGGSEDSAGTARQRCHALP
jgi:hypothetical protein